MNSTSRVSRRVFIKSTAAAAAAAPFIASSPLGAQQQQRRMVGTRFGDQFGLGVIGTGTQGRGLMGGFLGRNEVRVLAVCDVDTNRRLDAQKRVNDHYAKQNDTAYKGCAEYRDFRELLARKDIDAVVIATPDHWHAYIAIAAAKAKKDIYCEKPLCQSLHEAQEMVRAVRDNQRVFQTGSMQRSSKEFRVACELVRNGVIGKIERVEVGIGGPGKPCNLPTEADEPGLDWDMWLGPAPARGYHSELSPRGVHKHFPNWRAYREYGGGMVTDWGAHHFDIAQWGLGMDESGPTEIFPAADPKATHGVRFTYANGVEVLHTNKGGVWFFGKDGKVFVDRGKFELWIGDKQRAKETKDCDAMAAEFLSGAKVKLYNSTNQLSDFVNCMRNRERPICDVAIGARTVSVCHLVNLAYYHGEKIKWDPNAQQFAGGTGKKEWFDVPHRGEWKV